MKIRYNISPAEFVRNQMNLTPQEFSRRLGYEGRAYEFALERGYLTHRMMREVSVRFKVPIIDFRRLDGGK